MRRGLAVVVIGLAGTLGCAAEPPPAPWAAEAVRYFEAFDEAGARSISEQLRRFHSPSVRLDTWRSDGLTCEATTECQRWLESRFGTTADETTTGALFLDSAGAVRAVWHDWPSAETHELDAVDLGPDGVITTSVRPRALSSVEPVIGAAATARHEAAASRYLQAWSSGDPSAVADLYAADARIVDDLVELDLRGRGAIERHLLTARLRGRPPPAWRQAVLPDGTPAIYLRLRGVGGHPPMGGAHDLYVVSDLVDGAACIERVVVALEMEGHVVRHERRYHEVDHARRCLDLPPSPGGWWTGLEPPAALDDEVTGTVSVADAEIEVRNGTPSLDRFVRAAFEQIAAAGLPLPDVSAVAFDRQAHPAQCPARRDGCCLPGEGGAVVFVCATEAAICADEACSAFAVRWEHLLLHELAHAWLIEHTTPEIQQQFLDLRGLGSWSGPEDHWAQRGIEQAAEIWAWGVLDEHRSVYRLGVPSCDELAAAYRLLTGRAPNVTCPAA